MSAETSGPKVILKTPRTGRSSVAATGAEQDAVSSEAGAEATGMAPVNLKTKLKNAQSGDLAPRDKAVIDLRTLLQAGAHFGHQTSRWCPAMAPYIYTARNGIHIINLPRTVQAWAQARQAIVDVASEGGNVLFVGTKKQAQESVVEEARRCGSFYVSQRWLGGMLTNFQTIRKSIDRLSKIEGILAEDEQAMAEGKAPRFKKKERLMMSKEKEKLEFSIGGIRSLFAAPQLVFVVDIKREEIAVKEARRLDIPVVALVDTNCDPSRVNFAIPSNDDGTRAIRLFCSAVADAVMEGKEIYAKRPPKQRESRERNSGIEARNKMVTDFAAQLPAATSDLSVTPASVPATATAAPEELVAAAESAETAAKSE